MTNSTTTASDDAAHDAAAPTRERLIYFAERFGLLAAFALIFLYFWLVSDAGAAFGDGAQIELVLLQRSVYVIAGLGFILPLLAGQFDLSVAHNLTLTAVLTATWTDTFDSMWLAVVAALAVAGVVGLVNGLLVAHFEVHSLIATLGVQTLLTGFITRLSDGGRPVNLTENPLADLRDWPWPAVYAGVLCVAIWYVLEHTPFGRRLHAVGSNPSAARLSGIGVKRMIVSSFVLSGFLGGLGGVLLMVRDGAGNPNSGGVGYLLPVFAAAFLGATAFKRTFNVWGTVLAILGLAFTVKGLTLNGAKPYVEDWFNGAALLVATMFTAYMGRLRGRRMFL